MAQVLVVCRLCNPSSERYIAEHYYRSTAMSELLGVPPGKVYDERLYRALDALLPYQKALEEHWKNRLGELFGLEYDLLLDDVTSTYFEGEAKGDSPGLSDSGGGRIMVPEGGPKDEPVEARSVGASSV